jgi:hypothetical protein
MFVRVVDASIRTTPMMTFCPEPVRRGVCRVRVRVQDTEPDAVRSKEGLWHASVPLTVKFRDATHSIREKVSRRRYEPISELALVTPQTG